MADRNNPYSAPVADEEAQLARNYAGDLVDASPGIRVVHLIVDYVGFFLVLVAVFAVGGLLGTRMPPLIAYPVLIGYYLFFEGVLSATPGKLLTRSRVVSIDGSKPSFGQVLGRTFARFVPFEPFSCLSGSGWHDSWTKTRVVRRS